MNTNSAIEQLQREAQEIQVKVNKIFQLAKTNNWDFERFAKKILAGAVDNQTGYFAIGAQLIQNVIGYEGNECVQILKFLVLSTRKLQSTRIIQAQRFFFVD